MLVIVPSAALMNHTLVNTPAVYDEAGAKPYTFVRVVSYDQTSFQRAFQYTDENGKKWTTNVLTAIVTVKDGKV